MCIYLHLLHLVKHHIHICWCLFSAYLEFERGCPDDILVTTSSRSVVVTWDPPIFLANGVELTPDTPDYTPGSSFGIGRHKIKYEARLRGKRLKCDFKVYVRRKYKFMYKFTYKLTYKSMYKFMFTFRNLRRNRKQCRSHIRIQKTTWNCDFVRSWLASNWRVCCSTNHAYQLGYCSFLFSVIIDIDGCSIIYIGAFSITVEGCDGITVGRRCVKPYQETGLTEARARARCRNFGG